MKTVKGSAPIAATGGASSGKYAVVTPGDYLAVVKSAEVGHFNGTGKNEGIKFLKVTPVVVLLNEAKTEITRNDIVFGAVRAGDELYRPDGDLEKPALYGPAGWFISALGFVDGDNNVDLEGFDPKLVAGQVIRVTVETETFDKRDGTKGAKNAIKGYFPPKADDVSANNLYFDNNTGMVFLLETAADDYAELKAALGDINADEDTPDSVWGEQKDTDQI